MPSLKSPLDKREIYLVESEYDNQWYIINSQGGVINFIPQSLTKLKEDLAKMLDDKPSKKAYLKAADILDFAIANSRRYYEIIIQRKEVFANRGMLRSIVLYTLFVDGRKCVDDCNHLTDAIIYKLPIMFKILGIQKQRNHRRK